MMKRALAFAISAALFAAVPVSQASAQTTAPATKPAAAQDTKKEKKSEAKPEKKLTAQQQKMKDCGAKWQDEKKAKNVKGRDAYRKFLSTCLKG